MESSGAGVGGASGLSTGTTKAVSTGTLATSAATGIPQTTCDTFCSLASNCLPNCHHTCETYGLAPCESQGQALVNCYAMHFDPTTCGVVGCDQETQAFTKCRSSIPQSCGGGGGGGSETECGLTFSCAGGDERVLCEIQAPMAQCTCYLNYLPVGTCSGSVSPPPPYSNLDQACSVKKGCCAQFFGT